MTLRHIDGFDHYTDIAQKGWSELYANFPVGITDTLARTGSQSLALRHGMPIYGSTGGCSRGIPRAEVVTVGMAMYFPSSVSQGTQVNSCAFINVITGGTTQCFVSWFQSTLSVAAYQCTSFTRPILLGGSAGGVLTMDSWQYVEVQIRVHDTLGMVIVRIDGVEVLNLQEVDTAFSAGADYINGITLMGGIVFTSGWVYVDDLYILDNSGDVNNDFLGDVKVETLYPAADGAQNDWVPSTPGDHYPLVRDLPASYDDYLATNVPGATELYGLTPLSSAALDIKGVQWNTFAKEVAPGSRIVRPVVRQNGVLAYGDPAALSVSEGYVHGIMDINPITEEPWTTVDVHSDAEFGVELQS